jgi:hypothetical protein
MPDIPPLDSAIQETNDILRRYFWIFFLREDIQMPSDMIFPSEISKLAHQLGLGDKTIEKDYAMTWVLLTPAASPGAISVA